MTRNVSSIRIPESCPGVDGNLVLFNDAATGSTSITLNTTVAPQGVSFENGSKNYTLGGSGSIGGSGGVTKSNSGTVTFLTPTPTPAAPRSPPARFNSATAP
jgi:hypothetical protein